MMQRYRRSEATLLLTLLAVGCSRPSPPARVPTVPPGLTASPMLAPGISNPPIVPAEKATLAPEQPIVGVVVRGQARAYSLAALSHLTRHVVNDVLDGVPVTITYCDLHDCLRAYTAAPADTALPITQIGRSTDGLMLGYQGKTYAQASGRLLHGTGPPLPFPSLPAERLSWGEWKKKYPKTSVYQGVEMPTAAEGPSADPPRPETR